MTPVVHVPQLIMNMYYRISSRVEAGVEFLNLPSISSESWLGSIDIDLDSTFAVNHRSAEGSRLFASRNGSDTSNREKFNLTTSTGDTLVNNFSYDIQKATRGGAYTDRGVSNASLYFKGVGERNNPNDDTTISHDLKTSFTIDGVLSQAGFPNGHATKTTRETEALFLNTENHFVSMSVQSRIVQKFASYEVPSFDFGIYSEEGTYTLSNFRYVDKSDRYQVTYGSMLVESKIGATSSLSVTARNTKTVTEDFVLTTLNTGKVSLLPTDIAALSASGEIFNLLPSDGESLTVIRPSLEALDTIFLRAANIVSILSIDGYAFDAGSGNDKITGNIGDDILSGGSGNDTLLGGAGDDILTGGSGADRLTGGSGEDTFRFTSHLDLGLNSASDRILDFTKGLDLISLAGIDANSATSSIEKLTFVAASNLNNEANGLGRVWIVPGTSNSNVIQISTDSDKDPEYQIQVTLTGINPGALSAVDFLL